MDERTRIETIEAVKSSTSLSQRFRYVCTDKDGSVYACELEPRTQYEVWTGGGSYRALLRSKLPKSYLGVDWKDSLIDLCGRKNDDGRTNTN